MQREYHKKALCTKTPFGRGLGAYEFASQQTERHFPLHRNYTQYIKHCQRVKYGKIRLVMKMISYQPFYETLYRKGITEYYLIFKQGFSANTLHRMKKGEAISTKTLDALCYALDCEVSDIVKFIKE